MWPIAPSFPVALALLAALILSSPVELLLRLGLPRGLSALLILVGALATAAGVITLVWTPAQDWYASAPHTLAVIQKKVTPVARLMNRFEELTSKASQVGEELPVGTTRQGCGGPRKRASLGVGHRT